MRTASDILGIISALLAPGKQSTLSRTLQCTFGVRDGSKPEILKASKSFSLFLESGLACRDGMIALVSGRRLPGRSPGFSPLKIRLT
jgi:hypothetical protein